MPRGGARPGAGRPKNQPTASPKTAKAPVTPANPAQAQADDEGYKTNPGWPFGQERPPESPKPADLSGLTPLDYMLEVMRNPNEESAVRRQMAIQAAPYCHSKMGEGGKKEAKQAAAKQVASKFSPSAPPKLVANGGKKV